jgi:hypothetical protein
MNHPEEQLTSQDISLLRSLLGRFGGQPGSTPTPPAPPPIPSVAPPIPSPSMLHPSILQPPNRHSAFPPYQGPAGHPSTIPSAPVITPYHSALPGSQGHPPHSAISTVENIGSNITSQINQQRLAASARNLPSHVTLPQRTARRRRRGPAILPPTLTQVSSINSVFSNEGLIRIKVKVYPPQVSVPLGIFLDLN